MLTVWSTATRMPEGLPWESRTPRSSLCDLGAGTVPEDLLPRFDLAQKVSVCVGKVFLNAFDSVLAKLSITGDDSTIEDYLVSHMLPNHVSLGDASSGQ